MAHPHNEHRAHKVEKSRVGRMCGGYASGGAVKEREVAKKALASHKAEHEALGADGKKPKHRGDRVKRAKGGRVKGKHSGKTNVNVIVAPKAGGDGAPPMAGLGPKPPMPAMAPPPMAAGAPPPMAPKPPMMPPPGAGGPPGAPPMPMRKKGGRVAHDTKHVTTTHKGGKGKIEADPHFLPGPTTNNLDGPKTAKRYTEKVAAQNAKKELSHFGGSQVGRKRGGSVNAGADEKGKTGIGFRLPVQHSGNKDDTQNIGRGKPVTYARGGKVAKDANERGGKTQYARAEAFDKKPDGVHLDGDGNKPAGGRSQYSDGWKAHTKPTNRATGGPIYADGKEGVGMGPEFKEGSRSGLGRIEKAKRARHLHG